MGARHTWAADQRQCDAERRAHPQVHLYGKTRIFRRGVPHFRRARREDGGAQRVLRDQNRHRYKGLAAVEVEFFGWHGRVRGNCGRHFCPASVLQIIFSCPRRALTCSKTSAATIATAPTRANPTGQDRYSLKCRSVARTKKIPSPKIAGNSSTFCRSLTHSRPVRLRRAHAGKKLF